MSALQAGGLTLKSANHIYAPGEIPIWVASDSLPIRNFLTRIAFGEYDGMSFARRDGMLYLWADISETREVLEDLVKPNQAIGRMIVKKDFVQNLHVRKSS